MESSKLAIWTAKVVWPNPTMCFAFAAIYETVFVIWTFNSFALEITVPSRVNLSYVTSNFPALSAVHQPFVSKFVYVKVVTRATKVLFDHCIDAGDLSSIFGSFPEHDLDLVDEVATLAIFMFG